MSPIRPIRRRTTLKRLAKPRKTSRDVDDLIYMHCKSFLQRLVQRANSEAKTDNTNVIERKHVKAASEKILQELRGTKNDN